MTELGLYLVLMDYMVSCLRDRQSIKIREVESLFSVSGWSRPWTCDSFLNLKCDWKLWADWFTLKTKKLIFTLLP